MSLATRNENTGSNNGVEGLAAQELLLVGPLVELLRDVADGLGKGKLVAPAGDIAEGSEEVALGTGTLSA